MAQFVLFCLELGLRRRYVHEDYSFKSSDWFFCGPLDNINVFLCIINDVTYLSVALGVGL